MENVLNLILIFNALANGNGPKNSAASRTTLSQAVDKASDLLVVVFSSYNGTRGRIFYL